MKSLFGRYVPGEGFFYKLDPRLKLLIVIFYVVFSFFVKSYIESTILLIPLIFVYLISIKKFFPLIRMLKVPFIIFIVIFIVNIFTISESSIPGNINSNTDKTKLIFDPALFNSFWTKLINIPKSSFVISTIGFNRSFNLFIRIYTMVLVTTLLTNTTRPILLTKAIEDLMWPLKLIRVPTQIIAMIISIALRFIPTLLDETQRIMKAQSSRGVDFKNGNLKDKVISFTTLIIPLFVSSFAKADDLSDAMQTRGYEPYSKRTKYRHLKFGLIDTFVLLFMIALGIFFVVNSIIGREYLPDFWTKMFAII